MSRINVKSNNPRFVYVDIGFDPSLREFFGIAENTDGDVEWITCKTNGEFLEEAKCLDLDRSDPVTKTALTAIMLDLDPAELVKE